jgi:hypothetical protein
MTKCRKQQLEQLLNDIGEDMPLTRWKKKDFADAINLLLDDYEKLNRRFFGLRDSVVSSLARDLAVAEGPRRCLPRS